MCSIIDEFLAKFSPLGIMVFLNGKSTDMKKQRHCYLIRVQFLGFRFSGWQKQPQQKTVEGMLAKTLKFILPDRRFKILGAGRTDAKVSALDTAFEFFLEGDPIRDTASFLELFNYNLPPDIRVQRMDDVDPGFNIIKSAKSKEYIYLFSFGQKNHPFCAPFMANILDELNLGEMRAAALIFEGTHNFSSYTANLNGNTKVIRTITHSKIKENDVLSANFFPERSYAFVVAGEGFMRYQIRMMMGALIQLGKGELQRSDIERSLLPDTSTKLEYVAPGSGLVLNKLDFK